MGGGEPRHAGRLCSMEGAMAQRCQLAVLIAAVLLVCTACGGDRQDEDEDATFTGVRAAAPEQVFVGRFPIEDIWGSRLILQEEASFTEAAGTQLSYEDDRGRLLTLRSQDWGEQTAALVELERFAERLAAQGYTLVEAPPDMIRMRSADGGTQADVVFFAFGGTFTTVFAVGGGVDRLPVDEIALISRRTALGLSSLAE